MCILNAWLVLKVRILLQLALINCSWRWIHKSLPDGWTYKIIQAHLGSSGEGWASEQQSQFLKRYNGCWGNSCPFSSFCSCVLPGISWAVLWSLSMFVRCICSSVFPWDSSRCWVCNFCVPALRKHPGDLKPQICRQLFMPPAANTVF